MRPRSRLTRSTLALIAVLQALFLVAALMAPAGALAEDSTVPSSKAPATKVAAKEPPAEDEAKPTSDGSKSVKKASARTKEGPAAAGTRVRSTKVAAGGKAGVAVVKPQSHETGAFHLNPNQLEQVPIYADDPDFLDDIQHCIDDGIDLQPGQAAWHFVATQVDTFADPNLLYYSFTILGEGSVGPRPQQENQYYVITDWDDSLLDAWVFHVMEETGLLNLSHTCVNPPAWLKLTKVVVDPAGLWGPEDFEVCAEAEAPNDGANFCKPGDNDEFVLVYPDVEYTLSEIAPDGAEGFVASDWECEAIEPAFEQDGDKVTLEAGEYVECTITNTFTYLKLRKIVDNNDVDGADATAADFEVCADADAPDDGLNFCNAGDEGVFMPVYPDVTYILSESGPGGDIDYVAGDWECDNVELAFSQGGADGEELVLDPGDMVECTITNTAEEGGGGGDSKDTAMVLTTDAQQPSLGWLILLAAAMGLIVVGRWDYRRERSFSRRTR